MYIPIYVGRAHDCESGVLNSLHHPVGKEQATYHSLLFPQLGRLTR